MAAGLITISGTSGQVLLQYLDAGAIARSLIAGLGTLYLPDTGSAYTWTTLSGDAVAASGAIILVEVTTTCYLFDWEYVIQNNPFVPPTLKFDALIIGAVTSEMNTSDYPGDNLIVGENINSLNLNNVKAVAYKTVTGDTGLDPVEYFLIVKVQGDDIPYLRIKNEDNTHYIYLMGVSTTCLPAGYTAINTCEIGTELP